MNKIINIAIDGPASAGKSTIAKALAKSLGILYLDTGAMYRCLGLKALEVGLDLSDATAVERFLSATRVEMQHNSGVQEMYLDGKCVTAEIRRHDVSKMASDISALRPVRTKMADMQRAVARTQSCILDGREIGTFVLPDAPYKFFLTAPPEIRAMRRYLELKSLGQNVPFEQVLSDLSARDYNDSHREFAPLKCADDAIVIETADLTAPEVLNALLAQINWKDQEGN